MKICIISLDNWGYNQYIVEELKAYEKVEVHHINFDKLRYQYPSFFHKIFNFFTKHLFNYNVKRNHLNTIILDALQKLGHQDKILIIKADFLSASTLKKIKSTTDQLIAFYNDNVKRCPRIKKVHHLFDVNYSFEKEDVKKYGFNFLTNFIYHDHLEEKPKPDQPIDFEVFNVSSVGKRDAFIEKVAQALDAIKKKYKIIIVGKSKSHQETQIDYRQKKLDLKEVNAYVSRSKTLLDVTRKTQLGLTFRVMDSMAYHKKLITTNYDIKSYDFYNPNNILIISKEDIQIPNAFFDSDYEPVPKPVYEKYTLKHWVKTVFELI